MGENIYRVLHRQRGQRAATVYRGNDIDSAVAMFDLLRKPDTEMELVRDTVKPNGTRREILRKEGAI